MCLTRVIIVFLILVTNSVALFGQLHSEAHIHNTIIADSSIRITKLPRTDSFASYVEVGFQLISGISSGRNTKYYSSKPGIYSTFEISHSFNIGKFHFRTNPIFIFESPLSVRASSNFFPIAHPKLLWKNYLEQLNRYDNADLSSSLNKVKLLPSATSITRSFRNSIFSLSTDQINWGTAYGDRLVFSKNAPGFPHLGYIYSRKSKKKENYFKAEFIYGFIPSPLYTYDDNSTLINGIRVLKNKNNLPRGITGFNVNYSVPYKNPVSFGLNYTTLFYLNDFNSNLEMKVPILNYLFSFSDVSSRNHLSTSSIYFNAAIPSESLKFWGEYGFFNRSFSPHFLLINDTFPRGYILGAQKDFTLNKKSGFNLFFQFSSLGVSTLSQALQYKSWYISDRISQGFTNLGRVLGSGIGPGGESFYIAFSFYKKKYFFNVYFERLGRNQDFAFASFNPQNINPVHDYRRHWIDLTSGISIFHRSPLLEAGLSINYIHSFNYYWQVNGPNLDSYAFDKTGFRGSFLIRKYLFVKR